MKVQVFQSDQWSSSHLKTIKKFIERYRGEINSYFQTFDIKTRKWRNSL